MRFFLMLIYLLSYSYNLFSEQGNWTRFRGPNGQGISNEKSFPANWTEKNYYWKIELPGIGHSSPVVWNDIVFVTSADKDLKQGYIFAINVNDGNILWRQKFNLTSYRFHPDNSYASSSPTVDENNVYLVWFTREKTYILAYNHNGKKIWQNQFDGVHARHGMSSSPILFDDLLIFTREQEKNSPFKSSWVALDKSTGKMKWEIFREIDSRNSYSTPCIFHQNRESPLILFTSSAHGFSFIDPQKGTVITEIKSVFNHRVVTSPVISENIIIGTSKIELVAIYPSNLKSVEIKYTLDSKLTPYVPTPLLLDELLFAFLDNGSIACMNALTGEIYWKEKPAGNYYGSPVLVDGKIYCITRDGEVVVLKPEKKYELIAINPLNNKSYATPAISNGKMFLRTFSFLICIGS